MTIDLHFTDEDWARIEAAWTAWWAGELDRPLVLIDGAENPDTDSTRRFASNFPLDVPADTVIDHYQAELEGSRFYGDNWPKWWVNFGAGIMAGFLGAHVNSTPDTVWFSPPDEITGLETIQPVYDPDNVWWQRVLALTRTAVERWGDRATVGITDLGGNLDILASLRDTQRLLMDLCDAPDEVEQISRTLTRLWLDYYDELYSILAQAGRGTTPWASVWAPHGRCYMLQSDFCYMISPAMFERFVLPDLAACCDHLDHAFYHLDGKGQIPHLDMLLSLERLRGIQWIPGDGMPPPEAWLPLLKRIRAGGKLVQLYISAAGARTLVRELGGRGFALHISEHMTRQEAANYLQLLAQEGHYSL